MTPRPNAAHTHPHTLRHRGHTFEVTAPARDEGARIALRVDGAVVAERDLEHLRTVLDLADLGTGLDLGALGIERARLVVFCLRPGRIRRCALVIPPEGAPDAIGTLPVGPGKLGPRPERLSFEPQVGSWAHRHYRFERDHPTLYAARHVLVAVAQVAILLLGIKLAIDLIPWGRIPWPHLHIPRPDLPSLPIPDIDLPDVTLPAWLRAVLEAKKYWFPVLVAVVVAWVEVKRRRARQKADATSDSSQA